MTIDLINAQGHLRPVLKILTDYPRDDLAHDEVHQSLVTACMKRRIDFANLDVGAIPGMDTVTSGFKTAQLVLTSRLGFGHIFHTNCAPRKNIVSVKSSGEKIVLGMTRSGVTLLAVNAGYTLAHFQAAAKSGDIAFFQTDVPHSGSQFRSRDFFPDAMAELAAHLALQTQNMGAAKIETLLSEGRMGDILAGLSYLREPLNHAALPQIAQGTACYVDNFGNIKLNYHHSRLLSQHPAGTTLVLALGHSVSDAVVGNTGFSQGEGILAITAGSSGWALGGGASEPFSEIFLRGGRAESHFSGFRPGDPVLAVRKEDLRAVWEVLQGADRAVSERLDLYNISDARLIQMLSWAKLIRDGFDTAELRKSLDAGDLLARLAA
ncbi:MAG: hypothetical protein ACK4PK_08820 [Alphaproteobacteria bacterium]